MDYHALNAMLNLYDADGNLQLHADKEAARQYFLQNINQNTVFFHSLKEKLDYLFEEQYYDKTVFDQYSFEFIKSLFKRAYAHKFRFQTFLGAFKFYTAYALKTFDGSRYLERYEDRVVTVALGLARGDEELARTFVDEIISGRYQPATPTFLNVGKVSRGDLVSCYLMRIEDNLESIARAVTSSLQLSKRGGGVALLLTNLRELGAPIKKIENASSGVIPVMKILEDSFSYANQLGARQGAGAVYLHAHHPDILRFLDTKRENADEKIRIKTLSLGVVIPDITFQLAKQNADMYLFSPYDVERVLGKPFSDINVSEVYWDLVEDNRIKKYKINAREFFQTLAELQFESGYPYIMFEDTVNRANPIAGKINMSNLCVTGDTQILTDQGYRMVKDLYDSQEDFDVIADLRARDMNLGLKGTSVEKSTKMLRTAKKADIFKLTTKEGFELRATEWHKMYVDRPDGLVKIPLSEVQPGDKILVQQGENASWGGVHLPDLAYIAGVIAADGTFSRGGANEGARIDLYGDKKQFAETLEAAVHRVLVGREDLLERQATLTPKFIEAKGDIDKLHLDSVPLAKVLAEHGFTSYTKHCVPAFVKQGTRETQKAYLNGVWQMDACITGNEKVGNISIELGSIHPEFLRDMQRMLLGFGVYTRVYSNKKPGGVSLLPDGRGGMRNYAVQDSYTLRATDRSSREALHELVTWRKATEEYWKHRCSNIKSNRYYNTHRFRAEVTDISPDGIEDVYDVTVDNGNSVIFNGIATGQCSEISQVNSPSEFNPDSTYAQVGQDISCNLGSMNIALAMAGGNLGETVRSGIFALNSVSEQSFNETVPTIALANDTGHSIGLGQMNLAGFFGQERMHYGSPESVEFTSVYFAAVAYHAIAASHELAVLRGKTFEGFEDSTYATGEYFEKYTSRDWLPTSEKVKGIFTKYGISLPTREDWEELAVQVQHDGIYNRYLQAVPPTGSISYINNSTSSIHPVVAPIEIRKEGKIGRVYYPAPGLTQDNIEFFTDAYEVGPEKLIDIYAAATEHVDQGLSLTLFFKDTATTRDVNKAQIYAWRKGIKTIYYIRLRQQALEGTEVDACVSCTL